jgi:hypothetical protein
LVTRNDVAGGVDCKVAPVDFGGALVCRGGFGFAIRMVEVQAAAQLVDTGKLVQDDFGE